MKKLILAAMIAVGSATLVAAPLVAAHAGEGNGPSFPGMQSPDFGVTTTVGPNGGRSHVTTTEDHSNDAYANQTPTPPASYGAVAQRQRAATSLETQSPND